MKRLQVNQRRESVKKVKAATKAVERGNAQRRKRHSRNLYSRSVRFSFVEHYSTVASSQKEANAMFDKKLKDQALHPLGMSYGDLESEVISNTCDYKES